ADVTQAFAPAALLAIAHIAAIFARFLTSGSFRSRFGRSLALPLFAFCLLGFRFGFGRLFTSNISAERRALAVAVLADGQQESFRVGDDHVDHFITFLQIDAFHTLGVATHGAGVGLGEANGHAPPRAQDHLVAGLGENHVDERVAFFEADADDAAALRPA